MRYLLPALILFLHLPMQAFAGELYELGLDRPWRAGSKFLVEARGTSTGRMFFSGEDASDLKQEAKLTGTMEIIEPGKFGAIRRARVTVDAFQETRKGKPVDVLAKGTVVDCELVNDSKRFTVAGEELDEEAANLFDLVINLGSEKVATTELYHVEKQVRVGQVFQVDANAAAKHAGREVDPDDVKGSLVVGQVQTEQGVPCITVVFETTLSNMKGSGGPNLRTTLQKSTTIKLPVDTSQPLRQISLIKELTLTDQVNSEGRKVEARNVRTTELFYTPIGDK